MFSIFDLKYLNLVTQFCSRYWAFDNVFDFYLIMQFALKSKPRHKTCKIMLFVTFSRITPVCGLLSVQANGSGL